MIRFKEFRKKLDSINKKKPKSPGEEVGGNPQGAGLLNAVDGSSVTPGNEPGRFIEFDM
jgi:hypothetical protein